MRGLWFGLFSAHNYKGAYGCGYFPSATIRVTISNYKVIYRLGHLLTATIRVNIDGFLLAATIRCIIYCSFFFSLMSLCYCIVYLLLKSFFVE